MTNPLTPEEQRQAAEDRRAVLAPNPQEVNDFHRYSDYDNAPDSQHHTLGLDDNQASSGGHTHNGRDSKLLSASSIAGGTTPAFKGARAFAGSGSFGTPWIAAPLVSETFDTSDYHSTTTNTNRFTVTSLAGYYELNFAIVWNQPNFSGLASARYTKNGASQREEQLFLGLSNTRTPQTMSDVVFMNINDYVAVEFGAAGTYPYSSITATFKFLGT